MQTKSPKKLKLKQKFRSDMVQGICIFTGMQKHC